MMKRPVLRVGIVVGMLALSAAIPAAVAAHDPTCSGTLGIDVHGQHVVRDYVIGGALGSWPPSRGVVGDAVAGGGAATPGGPGPGFHFPNGFAPGASFCNESKSPGTHL
jgi:hypothetical protein